MDKSIKIAIFSESGYVGKVNRRGPNIRTDAAWVCSLGADHYPIPTLHQLPTNSYDVGIIIIPKNKKNLLKYPLIENMKGFVKKYLQCRRQYCGIGKIVLLMNKFGTLIFFWKWIFYLFIMN